MADRETRRLRTPLTGAMLAPLGPGCRFVHLEGPLSDAEASLLADLMRPRPDVWLTVYGSVARVRDLEFLRFLPWLGWLHVLSSDLQDLSGLACLEQLRTLFVSGSRHRLSAAPLAALAPTLRHLILETAVSRTAALSELTGLRTLTLRSVKMPDLSALTSMTELRGLDLKGTGTTDLGLLPEFSRLRYFEARRIRRLSDLGPVAETTSLEELCLRSLSQVSALPPLHQLTRLRRITLENMRGLTDLSVLLTAPALDELDLALSHLSPGQVTPLAAHPALRRAGIHMGSAAKNAAVRSGLALPPIASPSLYLALKHEPFPASQSGITDDLA